MKSNAVIQRGVISISIPECRRPVGRTGHFSSSASPGVTACNSTQNHHVASAPGRSNLPGGYCAVQTVGRHFDPSGSFLKWEVVMKGWFRFFESSTIVVTVNH